MIRRQFSSISASIVGIFEGKHPINSEIIGNAAVSMVNSLINSSTCTGKKGESNLLVAPNGEVLAVVGLGTKSEQCLGKVIRNAVKYFLI